jgi:hypothetical protein
MDNSKPKILTATKAASFLNISVSSVKILSDKNVIPSWKTSGGHRRYDENELANYKFEIRRNLKKLNAKIIILTNLPINIDDSNKLFSSGLLEVEIFESLPDVYFSFSESVPEVIIMGMKESTMCQIEKISSLKHLITKSNSKVNFICLSENKNISNLLSEQKDDTVILMREQLTEEWIRAFVLGFYINFK